MITIFILQSFIIGSLALPIEPVDEMEALLDRLAFCESSNRERIINIMDGDASSFGTFQFKIQTFVHFGRRYGLPHDNIWSPEQQRAIARAIILDGRGETHFKNCWRKLKLNY